MIGKWLVKRKLSDWIVILIGAVMFIFGIALIIDVFFNNSIITNNIIEHFSTPNSGIILNNELG